MNELKYLGIIAMIFKLCYPTTPRMAYDLIIHCMVLYVFDECKFFAKGYAPFIHGHICYATDDLFATAFDWIQVSDSQPIGLFWFLVISFFNGIIIG